MPIAWFRWTGTGWEELPLHRHGRLDDVNILVETELAHFVVELGAGSPYRSKVLLQKAIAHIPHHPRAAQRVCA